MASDKEIQKELDAHISRLELELCELKQRRNTLSPISRLPPEILCQIFLLNIEDYSNQSRRMLALLPPATPLSHVSHTWRRVAIGCPELWGIIRVGVLTRGEMLTVAAARSQQSPITLTMRCFLRDETPTVPSGEVISTLSKIIREGTARCSTFDLYAREDSLQSLLSGVPASFDSLTTLKLDIVRTEDGRAPLTELLQCTFPRLRHLTVQRPPIPIDCSLLQSPHLTHVDVDGFRCTSTLISDLLALLKRSLCLRSLSCAIPFKDLEVPVKGGSPIHSPKLELLKFSSRLDNAVQLLSSISFPSRCRLDVDSRRSGESAHFMSSVAQAYGHVAPIALQLDDIWCKAWDISSVDTATGQVNIDNTPWIQHRNHGRERMSLWDYVGWSFANLRVLIIAHVAVKYEDSQTVIDAKQAVAARLWTFLADSAISLEVIHIANSHTRDAATDALMDCLRGAKRGQSNPTVPWPTLHTLRSPLPSQSQWVQQYKRRREDASTPSLHHQLEYALDLVDALKAREINGSKSSLRPLTLLEFNTPFAKPLEDDASLILRSGAATVKWQT